MFFPTIFLAFCLVSAAKTKSGYKNVLFIVADDLGWADVGYANNAQVKTPNINNLVQNSIILNQSYVYPFCTPSRASLLSGVYAERSGLQHDVILPQQPVGLPTAFTLIPEVLQRFGYATHIVGKWHLGFCGVKYTPCYRGFDTFYGYFNAQIDYYEHTVDAKVAVGNVTGYDYWNQTKDYLEPILDKNNTYSMFTYTDRAIEILENHDKSEPFFMYFASQNAHSPLEVPQKYQDIYKDIEDENRRKLLAMVSVLDEAIGNITQALSRLDLLDDTLIFFTSDNGGATYASGRNVPLRGGKMTVYEGGTRVRGFISGKELKPYIYDGMFHAVDWMPTILHAAIGSPVDVNGIDGVDLWPAVTNNQVPSPRTSFIYTIDQFGSVGCNYVPTEAVRNGDWKLIVGCVGPFPDYYPLPTYDEEFARKAYSSQRDTAVPLFGTHSLTKNNTQVYLFNIKDDPYETNNVASQHPDIVTQLTAELDAYKKITVVPITGADQVNAPASDPNLWGGKWSPGWC